jgi:hypothetical protein
MEFKLAGAKILAEQIICDCEEQKAVGVPINTLPAVKPPPKNLPPEPRPLDFAGAGIIQYTKDGQHVAALATLTKPRKSTLKIRLIKLATPSDGKQFLVWVINDFGEGFTLDSHWPGGLYACEPDARAFYNQALAHVLAKTKDAIRAISPPVPVPAPVNPAIASLREMARLYPANKSRYLAQITALETESRQQAELKCTGATLNRADADAAHNQAVTQLVRELFPNAASVKSGPEFQKRFARAMNCDYARLGVNIRFETGEFSPAEIVDLARAINAKSPHKPAQAEAVLNWLAKEYCNTPESQWTATVAKKAPGTKPGGLARTIRGKFKLKSNIGGRPEKQ